MKLPKEPHLRPRFIYDNLGPLVEELAAEGFASGIFKSPGDGIADPRYAAAHLLRSGMLQFLPQSKAFLVMGPDGRYAEGTKAELCEKMISMMRRLSRQTGVSCYIVEETPRYLIRALEEVAEETCL